MVTRPQLNARSPPEWNLACVWHHTPTLCYELPTYTAIRRLFLDLSALIVPLIARNIVSSESNNRSSQRVM